MLGFHSRRLFARLFTWGANPSSLGLEKTAMTTSIPLPRLLDFPDPIKKVDLGPNHSAFVTESGDLFTFGSGNHGALGHDNEDKLQHPKKIESLSKLQIKVKDVAVGTFHTVILTEDGEVWTMGFGGKLSGGLLRKIFSQMGGGLGHGDMEDRFVPNLITSLKDVEDMISISAGIYHSTAVGQSGAVFVWGKGEMGVLGTASNRTQLSPHRNKIFEELRHRNIKVSKLQTHHYSNIALMDNGKLLSWGWNEVGQLALGNYVKVDMYDTENRPMEPEFFRDMTVKNFELGEECSVFLTDDNRVFFSGIRLYREPIQLNVPKGVIVKSIFACKKIGGYITDDNRVYCTGNLFSPKMMEEDIELRMWKVKSEVFHGMKVEKIGGPTGNNYCFLS
jgi:alpha-tubulin suppressor-like RCC1 family protein